MLAGFKGDKLLDEEQILSRRGAIGAFLAMDVMRSARAKSRAGADICHMEVGEPGTQAPLLVRERAKRHLDEGLVGYTEALGLPDLRARIARHYDDTYGVSIDAEQVVVTTGSSAGFVLAFLATLDAGDKVAIMRPGYPCYREILKALDLVPVDLPVGFETGWQPQIEDVEAAIAQEGVKALLLASPANPTGALLDDALITDVAALCADKQVWLMMDEIYHGLIYEKATITAAGLNDRVIVLNSFSKYYSMTGWRIGWMVVPPALTRALEILNQNLFISAPSLSQIAAEVAFDATDELEAIKAGYQRKRAVLRAGLRDVGLDKMAPLDGAFYAYVDVSDFTDDSLAFSKFLLESYGIAACPGLDFDPVQGHLMMRFSYAGPEDEIGEFGRRMKQAFL